MTDQQWLEFLAALDLVWGCEAGEESLLSLFFEERNVAGGEAVYERGGLLHTRKIALVIAGELARAYLPASEAGGRPRP